MEARRPRQIPTLLMLALAGSVLLGAAGCRVWSVGEVSLEDSVADHTAEVALERDPIRPVVSEESSSENAQQVQTAERLLSSHVLQDEGGIRPTEVDSRGWYYDHALPGYLPLDRGVYRWRHRALERLLEDPKPAKNLLAAGLQSPNVTTQAAAFVGMVRMREYVPIKTAERLINDDQVSLSAKAALLESLAILDTPAASQLLSEVFASADGTRATDTTADISAAYQRTLWAAMAQQHDDGEAIELWERQFAAADHDQRADILDALLIARNAPDRKSVV